jgi:hypothetical protein
VWDNAKVVGRWHDNRNLVIELAEPGAGGEVIMSIAGHVSRAMLSRYSHVRMEAKRRALDEIAALTREHSDAIAGLRKAVASLHGSGQEPGKGSKLEQLQPTVTTPPAPECLPLRSGFRLTPREPEASSYSVDPSLILSSIAGAAPLDRSDRFAALAQKERAERLLRRLAARGTGFS